MIRLVLAEEKEILEDCAYCGKPFDLAHNNKRYAVEIDGERWMHRDCAATFANRLHHIATWAVDPEELAK